MITHEDMLSYFERRGDVGAVVAKELRKANDESKTTVCFYAVRDFKADERVVYLDAYVDAYAKQMVKKYREDPVKYAQYRPAVKRAVSLDFGL
ncbi:hypothetical protein N7335_02055 [Stutzerimonas stutzeri]|uniref:Uncharacterized protein n=1 Tax=Stutzerimonas stutzeri TaxID=316 RepID=A0AA42H6M3_STUST|nr:hypothetical protein [Stutzerimonas stutzeri]MDH0145170.1 hypothetical protein [Stutzerimonas stutzeri]MDH0149575.1 hypothetical protein [Stutzerimonas stutzeri]